MRRVQIIGALCLAAVACLIGSVSASAAPMNPWLYKFSFGEDPEHPHLGYQKIVVNQQTGNILVAANDGLIHQFDSNGEPLEFSATGSPVVPGSAFSQGFEPDYQLVINNGGGAGQGDFYVWDHEFLRAYNPDGSPLGESPIVGGTYGPGIFQPQEESLHRPVGLAIDASGILWLFDLLDTSVEQRPAFLIKAVEMTAEVAPTGVSHTADGGSSSEAVFNGSGDLYTMAPLSRTVVFHYDAADGLVKLGTSKLSVQGPTDLGQLAADPATDDIYLSSSSNSLSPSVYGLVSAIHPEPGGQESDPIEVFGRDEGLRAAGGVGFDATGQTLYVSEGGRVDVFHREPPSTPQMFAAQVSEVGSRAAVLQTSLIENGGPLTFHFEYGPTTAYGNVSPTFAAPRHLFRTAVGGGVGGLDPNTTYHFRIVATNPTGTVYGPDGTFTTYPAPADSGVDPCPNALARKQTTAQRLPDCRAYELASASDTGGYDVESYLSPGQNPFPGFPLAADKLLYATHSGAVPGPWNATNKGPDPYVATRGTNGWSTQYEGLPSDLNPAAGSFSSVLGEADSSLSKLAFAGPNLCSPCFIDGGLETGIPVRMPSGQLVQGMAGSLSGSVPASAKPEGKVARYFSGDGRDLLFASKYAFEPGANDQNGSLTVYERDLTAGSTEIVSTDPSGNALTGTVSELGVSGDGSRVAIGKEVSTDPQGNEYVHPYLHLAGTAGSVDLAPTTTSGVLYAGMNSDGSKAFFTTPDQLNGEDTDSSADLYEADVNSSGGLSLKLVSASNSDACSPVANEAGEHWNSTGANVDCSAVAISGGGGVASSTGAVYFLSPEQLNGEGTLNQPNLYLATPGGSLQLVATLEPNNPLVLDSVKASMTRRTADFQTTPSGNYAAFTSDLDLTSLLAHGFRSVYRYAAGSNQLECASCDRTNTSDPNAFAAVELPPNGLALLEDGRVFFTTAAQLSASDANRKKDVFEWSGSDPQLISAGTGPFDSGLLTASADGTDVFFFTRDDLAPTEDHNGSSMRIYDAREGGGYFKLPPDVPCQASDECHGPGTPAPGPADVKSSGKTTPGNVLVCAKNRVKKRGVCVKKAHAKKHHQKKKHAKKRKHAAKQRAAATNGKRGGRNA